MSRSVWKGPFVDDYVLKKAQQQKETKGRSQMRRLFVRRIVVRPPGHFARTVLAFVFSKKAFESVFSQAIIDMREEHAEALAEGDHWKARWIVARDHSGLVLTILTYICASTGKKIVAIWKMIG